MLMKPTSSMSGVTYGPGPGEAHPRAVGARLGEDAAPHVLGQVVADRELGPHDAVGLRVAAALEVAGLPEAADLRGERVDDRPGGAAPRPAGCAPRRAPRPSSRSFRRFQLISLVVSAVSGSRRSASNGRRKNGSIRRSTWMRKSSTASSRSSSAVARVGAAAARSPGRGAPPRPTADVCSWSSGESDTGRRARRRRGGDLRPGEVGVRSRVVSSLSPLRAARATAVSATPPASRLAAIRIVQRRDGARRAGGRRHAGSGRPRARRSTRGGCSASAR